MKTLVGVVTFGNLAFSRKTIWEINNSTKSPIDFLVVVGKPGDMQTRLWLESVQCPHIVHETNKGFPASLNDIYDYAWKQHSYDALIIAGNDVVPYPGTVDALIHQAETTDWEWVAASQYDVKTLIAQHPETRKYFKGENLVFDDFTARPWEAHTANTNPGVAPDCFADVHNLCLFKPSVAKNIGYIDVNLYPAYFSDNDYCRRAVNAGVKACTLSHAQYFHFWSRTIHQGGGGSTNRFFNLNAEFYRTKWGGDFGKEKYTIPFGGKPYELCPGVTLEPSLKIGTRENEAKIIEHWKQKGS